jgi:phage FluMu protein Com
MEEITKKKLKVKLVVHSGYAEQVRCKECASLLFKAKFPFQKSEGALGIEVKCKRCGKLNCF